MKSSAFNLKKIFLSIIIVFISVIMIGCSNANTKAMETLNEELENISNVVSSTNSSEISSVSPLAIYKTSNSQLDDFKALSSINMSREEEIRQKVLTLNSYIKSFNNENLKLSKSKISAIQTLTKDIKKYNQQLKNTKSELKSSVDNIKKNTKKSSSNFEVAETSYLSLNNCMNQRYVYLCNLYNNLEQVYILLYKDCDNCYIADENNSNINNQIENREEIKIPNQNTKIETKETETKTEKTFKKNIDSYQRNDVINDNYANEPNYDNKNNNFNYNYNNQNPNNNINTYNHPPFFANNKYNTPFNNYSYPYTMPYGYGFNNGMFGNGYYNGGMFGNGFNNYGYPFGGMPNTFNPNRNTDTFYAFNKNIDTYRFCPNAYNNGIFNNVVANEIPATAQAEISEEQETFNENSIKEIKENTKKLKPNNVINLENENID